MTMRIILSQTLFVCLFCLFLDLLVLFPCETESSALGQNGNEDLYIEPAIVSVNSGENVTFTCSSPANVSFVWRLENASHPYSIITGQGIKTTNYNNRSHFWSSLELPRVKRTELKKISCSAEGKQRRVSASLIVNGVRIGDVCHSDEDCLTEKALCLSGICSCPLNKALLRLKNGGPDVCSELIFKLYDPCEFSEQCVTLVDAHSLCGTNGICTCVAWATDFNGKCVPKSELTYTRNQEMYRVGLIAVTCIIIVIVAVSLWVTLRRSCHEQISITPRRSVASIRNSDNPRLSSSTIFEIATDKPPSYDELVEIGDTVTSSPPNMKDALKNCMTPKKLIRQVSAPAGQLLSKASSPNNNQSLKSGCVSPVFTNDE